MADNVRNRNVYLVVIGKTARISPSGAMLAVKRFVSSLDYQCSLRAFRRKKPPIHESIAQSRFALHAIPTHALGVRHDLAHAADRGGCRR